MVIFSNLMKSGDAQIAQSVEQRTENPRVDGSIPSLGISFYISKYTKKYRHNTFI